MIVEKIIKNGYELEIKRLFLKEAVVLEKEISIQNERLDELFRLKSENPDLRVLPMVDGELGGAYFAYWAGSLGKVEIDYVYYTDEKIYFKSYDIEELEIKVSLTHGHEFSDMTGEEVCRASLEKVENFPWEKVIVLKIELP